MIIQVNSKKTIADFRNEFSGVYPFLNLEFYDTPHQFAEISSYKDQLPHDKTIHDICKTSEQGNLEIQPWFKTGKVENEFKRIFGLNVQIFRRQGDTWIQTAGTDELTLEEQNEMGRYATENILQGINRSIENEKPI
ncbi:MAG: hypothetical protein JST17_03775 [Bacteroidetes bacterium]|nr:hypothetical protein [Bacteroidota bacterium]MBS1929528.1 hypothetical protein [Bacteroidota bacterium]